MSRLRLALREAALLIVAATALGFIYTAAMEKGLFGTQRPASIQSLAASANAPVMISRDQARSYYESGNSLFIDARHEYDYKLSHIKGAVNIPLTEYVQKKNLLAEFPKEKLIVIYCDGADCNSSIELSAKLFIDGYTNVKIFFGGWGEWKAADLPIEKSGQ